MWAGGSFEWPKSTMIRIGNSITEHTQVVKVEHKAGMIFIDVEKILSDKDSEELLLKEIRTHVYRPSLDDVAATTPTVAQKPTRARSESRRKWPSKLRCCSTDGARCAHGSDRNKTQPSLLFQQHGYPHLNQTIHSQSSLHHLYSSGSQH
jgi:hypothetical protein